MISWRLRRTGLFATHWQESITDFEGVLRRRDKEARGISYEVTVHLVELVHPDTKKTLQLYKAYEEEGIRKLWEDAARVLNLPSLEEGASRITARAPEDLDKSFRELAAERGITIDFDADAPPPTGIVWEKAEDELRVTIGLQANSYVIVVGLIVVAALFLLIPLSLLGWDVTALYFLGIIVLAYVIAKTLYLPSNVLRKRRIVITPREVHYSWSRLGINHTKTIPLQELETVRRIDDELVMESDTEKISVGGLKKQPLHWLERFILAAMIDPPTD